MHTNSLIRCILKYICKNQTVHISRKYFARLHEVRYDMTLFLPISFVPSFLFFLLPTLLSLSRCIVFLSSSEHLQADWAINYLYWASVPVSVVLVNRPYHCQSISNVASVRLRQTFRRNQPIYCGTMDQHDSIVSCRLRIKRSLPLFLRSDRYLYRAFSEPLLRFLSVFLITIMNVT